MTTGDAIPRILKRTAIRENRLLAYVEEEIADRHGDPYTYYLIEAKFDCVLVVPVLPDGRLLLESIYRHPYRKRFLEFPAGGIEPGEDPLAAARRELGEETGYRAGRLLELGAHEALPGLVRMRLHVVLAEELAPGALQAHDRMELIELAPTSLADAQAASAARAEVASAFLSIGLLYYERHLARPA